MSQARTQLLEHFFGEFNLQLPFEIDQPLRLAVFIA